MRLKEIKRIIDEENSPNLRSVLQSSDRVFEYTASNNAWVKGKFGVDRKYGEAVALNYLHAHKTSMLKGQGEGRGTKILAEVLREAVRRGIKYYTFNAPSDAAQALHRRFVREKVLKPYKTYKDIGGVSDTVAAYKIISRNPVKDMERKYDLAEI